MRGSVRARVQGDAEMPRGQEFSVNVLVVVMEDVVPGRGESLGDGTQLNWDRNEVELLRAED